MFKKVLFSVLLVLFLALLAVPVQAQGIVQNLGGDPSPPWQATLPQGAWEYRFFSNQLEQHAWLPQNSPGETVGVYGFNEEGWVMTSPWVHVVPRADITNISGWPMDVDPEPLWQAVSTGASNCSIYTLDSNGLLKEIGQLPVGKKIDVGVYARRDDGWAMISAWLHFVPDRCLTGPWSVEVPMGQSYPPATVTPLWTNMAGIPQAPSVRWNADLPETGEFIIMALPAAALEPTPIGEFAVGTAVFGIWLANDGPAHLATAVVDGVGRLQFTISMMANGWTPTPVDVGDGKIFIPTSPDHHIEHNVTAGSEAWEIAQQASQALNGGPRPPDDEIRCLILKIGDKAARALVWVFTHTTSTGVPRGDVVWWHAKTPNGGPQWGGGYGNKSGNTLTNVPKDLRDLDAHVEESSCDDPNFPMPPLLPG